jgi:hypothetical protein
VAEEIRAVDTLVKPDYAYACELTAPGPSQHSAEQWARAIFEGAPRPLRQAIVIGWTFVLGFRLGPRPSADHVLGWRIVTATHDVIILEVRFRLGTAHNVVRVEDTRVLLATFVRYETRGARAVWSAASVLHHRIIPYLLKHAALRPPFSMA